MEKFRETLKVTKERAILVAAVDKFGPGSDDLAELSALADSAGAIVVDKFQQKIRRVNPSYYIGKGKAQQLAQRVERFEADVVIFDNNLSPAQIKALEAVIGAKVLDRSELILDIFASRARTKQAKLQVELAQLEYTYPRLTKMWTHLDSVAGAGGGTGAGVVGGIGTRGPGEKQLEVDRRLVNNRITELKRELDHIDKRKVSEIDSRKGLFKICLVGYTNSGKSTLLNTLTDAGVQAEDRLFATLDTRTKKWNLQGGEDVLLSDTVGFVRNLPHQLVASFKATLEEAINADLLLHVVDISNSEALAQVESVKKVLKEIGCAKKPMLTVLNKVDAVLDMTQLETMQTLDETAICVSARTSFGIEQLTSAVLEQYRGGELTLRVTSSTANGRLQSFLRAKGTIIDEQYTNEHVCINTRLGSNQLAQLKSLGPENVEIVSS